MAITDQLTTVKDYFLNWHRDNYAALHNSISNEVTNTQPKKDQAVTSGAVYTALNNKFNEVTTCTVKQCNNNSPPLGSLQLTLDDFDTRINNVTSTIQTASNGTLTQVLDNSTYYDPDERGFIFPDFDNEAHQGFMTPKDKLDLYYATSWFERSGRELGTNTTISNHLTAYINLGLRLVYCYFEYKNCPWLKNAYNNNTSKEYYEKPFINTNELFYYIRPKRTIWAPTNANNIRIGITSSGVFYVRSDEYIKDTRTINGSLFWFYGDGKPSTKINAGGND